MTSPGPYRNLFELLERRARSHPNHVASRSRRRGEWEWTTWGEWYEASRALAAAWIERGVEPGDRIALIASTREEWAHTDFGILGAGAVTVPIYPTYASDATAAILENSGATIAVVEGRRQLETLTPVLGRAPSLREIVVIDAVAAGVEGDGTVGAGVRVSSYGSVLKQGRERLARAEGADRLASRSPARDALATIVYTSGTTGQSRGAMLTHDGCLTQIEDLLEAFGVDASDEQLLFLPLAHILARILLFAHVASGSRLAYATDAHRLMDDIKQVEPTLFAAVPRFFEKVYSVVTQSAEQQGPLKAALFSWAVGVGRNASRANRRGEALRGLSAARARYADELVLKRVRSSFGGRLRFVLSGGAPLSPELAEWFHACHILVLDGYGLTEAAGPSHVNREARHRLGTVGLPLRSVEARIGADGEVLLRGPSCMRGYFRDEEATRAAIDADGWLHTGDIGRIDADGFLTIVDRKKDVIVTAGGSNVAPHAIERLLAASPWISHAVVFGDRKPYLVALVTLNETACRRWARERKRPADLPSLARDPELRALVQLDVDATNRKLASFETIKRFAVLETELTTEGGELTDTLKVRRRAIQSRHAALIEGLYDR